jgi:serine/threonine protein kinase
LTWQRAAAGTGKQPVGVGRDQSRAAWQPRGPGRTLPKPNPTMSRIPTDFDPDERRTVTGQDAGAPLPVGYRLQEFVIEGLIGEGGFSIVYVARDTRLQRQVALKEYIPSFLARRRSDLQVTARSQRCQATFDLGLRSFVNEAQLLASFDHPALVRVYRFWEENGTAYMVMPYVRAPTLKHWLRTHTGTLDETWLRGLLEPLIDALELMHADRCYHRDIAPDNILLIEERGGAPKPLLLDLGAARRVIGDATQTLTVILKPGYAPIEQYSETGGARQGPWTDIYALCAVMYSAVTGSTPAPSVSRVIEDEVVPASRAVGGLYTPQLLAAIDAGMAVLPEHRPQSLRALRALLDEGSAAAALHEVPADLLDTVVDEPALAPYSGFAADALRPDSPVWANNRTELPAPKRRAPAAVVNTPADSGVTPGIWLTGAVLVALAGGAVWWLLNTDMPPPARKVVAPVATQQAPQDPAAAAALPASEPLGQAPQASAEGSAARKDTPAAEDARPAEAAAAPSAPQYNPAPPALQDIVRQASPQLLVVATTDKPTMTIGRDRLRVRVQSAQAGYVYLYLASTDRRVYLLFPNRIDSENRIEAGQSITLPKEGWNLTAEGPPGMTHVVAMVSRVRRDLSGSGLHQGRGIPDFDMNVVEQRWRLRMSNPLVGRPQCEPPLSCSDAWGAAQLQIEEVAATPRR